MPDTPLISILTPAYNHQNYIHACIQSVLDQTYENWEQIIVNDGSVDKTGQIAGKFAAKDPRIKLFEQENHGIFRLAETYNFALSKAQGEYIAILEGDDFWVRDKLEIQVKSFQDHPESVLCWGKATSVIGDEPGIYETHPKCESKNSRYYFNQPLGSFFNIVFDDFPPPLTFLIKKEALLRIGQFQQIQPFPAVDLPTVLALSLSGPFHFDPIILGSWRQHANQTTKNNSVQLIEGSSRIIVNHYHSFPPEVKQNLVFDLPFINKTLESRKVISYSRSGRFKLIRKNFREARADYRKSLATGGPLIAVLWKLRSLTGLVLSYLKMDVEGLSKLMGKKSYKQI